MEPLEHTCICAEYQMFEQFQAVLSNKSYGIALELFKIVSPIKGSIFHCPSKGR